ncbi:MAG: penicillin-insensitive murein endopeptidase [Nannocystaceae bacterium]
MLAALAALALLVGRGEEDPDVGDEAVARAAEGAAAVDAEADAAPDIDADALDEADVDEAPREWIKHTVIPRERLSQIAARYGVTREDVVRWNDLSGPRVELKRGARLRVHARQVPPPREEITYEVVEGDTWSSVAVRHRVDYRDLLAWNWPRPKELEPGLELSIWVDPGAPRTVNLRHGPPPPPLPEGLDGSQSVGRPARGRLRGGVQLPESELYTRGHERWLWGSSHALRSLITAIGEFRYSSGYAGEIVVGSMSRRRGGRFPPHRSHQSGRDADIRLPLLPGVPSSFAPNADEIDWSAAWELVRHLVATDEVEVIFLEGPLQRRLYQAALWEGAVAEELRPIIAWPNRQGNEKAIVRHSRGHDGHIHVRFRCGFDEPRCRPRRRRPTPPQELAAVPSATAG